MYGQFAMELYEQNWIGYDAINFQLNRSVCQLDKMLYARVTYMLQANLRESEKKIQ